MTNLQHPRYLLDEESKCYGCERYISIEEADDTSENFDDCDVDIYGGFCNCSKPCINGEMYIETVN